MIRRNAASYLALAASVALLSIGVFVYQSARACKLRGLALQQRIEALERSAHNSLPIGTKEDEVVRFFEENQIPLVIHGDEASGTIYTSGCCPFGCGSDDVLIGVKVKLDDAGSVKTTPQVGGICTNCL